MCYFQGTAASNDTEAVFRASLLDTGDSEVPAEALGDSRAIELGLRVGDLTVRRLKSAAGVAGVGGDGGGGAALSARQSARHPSLMSIVSANMTDAKRGEGEEQIN